jgi:hypothetical protein
MRFTQILADKKAQITADWGYGVQFLDLLFVSKRLDPGSSHPTKPLRALAGTPTARDDTVFNLLALFWGNLSTIPPFHLSTFNNSWTIIPKRLDNGAEPPSCPLRFYSEYRFNS